MGTPEEILTKTLQEIATKEGINNCEFIIKQLSSDGANYSSQIFNAKIVSPDRPELDLFAKVASVSEAFRTQMKVDRFYAIEGYVYHELVKKYMDIQEKYKVPEEDRFIFPKFYGSNANRSEETIVLENLTAQRYTMFDRFKSVTWEFASKSIEELAKFHALSFAFKNEEPDVFPSNESTFNMTQTMSFDDFAVFAKTMDMMYAFLDKKLQDRLRKFIDENWTEASIAKYYGPWKWTVLAHGDYRPSNIMFKRQGGKVKSLVPVDYQTVRLSSPSTDLYYFIYSGTDEGFRKLHLKPLLNHYYATLSKFLTMFEMDPEIVFSRKDFDEDFKEMAPYGLITTMFLLPLVMVDPANAPKMSTEGADMANMMITPSDAFKKRFIPTIEGFMKMGVL